ncbi:MAG: hypothetical protein K2K98_12360 [Muribaculaceae bacterium]|nr:hypothetical protein [Muribaculaceae bacterium]
MVTDRDLYCGGDTVWFRVFIVDASSHQLTDISKYTYVELLNPFGEIHKRIKIIEKDGLYRGFIPIDEDIYEGDYTLAAYTMYSENQGKDYFFRKPLRILDPHSSKYEIDSEFTSAGAGVVRGTFRVRSKNGEKINYNIMSWTMPDGNFLEMPDASKGFSRKFQREKGEEVVLVRFGDYRKYIPVKYPVERTDIAFYPEGGWLVASEPCTVAFKATDENGKGVSASGVIYDDYGEKIADFSTVHNGMGCFTFVPEDGRSYTAEYMGPEAELRTAEIGTPKTGATSLRYRSIGNKSIFSVAGGKDRDLELVVSLRGSGVFSAPITSDNPLSLNNDDMKTGLYQAFIVSRTDSVVLSERLFFIGATRPHDKATKLSHDSVSIKLKKLKGTSGDCSVRIINGKMVPGKPESDIRTQLMLQSELRGRIEQPSYYFSESDYEAERNLDLLMMVNGWSRYNIPEAILGRYEEPQIPLEIGQEVSGQVRSRWKGKPMKGVMVSAIVPKYNFGTFADTDSNGEFSLNGFDFPEGTVFIFRAMNEKGGNESNFDIHKDEFPDVDKLHKASTNADDIYASEFFNGMRWVMLDELKVQAFNPYDNDFDIYKSLAAYSKNTDDLASRGITSLEQAVRSIPGMIIKDDHLMYRRGYVAVYIDGVIYETAGGGSLNAPRVTPPSKLPGTFATSRFADSSLANANPYNTRMRLTGTMPNPETSSKNVSIPTLSDIAQVVAFQDIDRLDYLKSESFIIGEDYGAGVLMITTKSGNNKPGGNQFELKDYLPLGYQQYKEYASPILSVDTDEYDLQTKPTLLWLPSVKFDGKGKSIDLKFPIKPDYRVIVEGVADNGDIISETL